MTQIDVVLADHAQVVANKLFISGGGINIARFPERAPAGQPYPVTFAIAGTVEFGLDSIGEHVLAFEVTDADGGPAAVGPDGARTAITGEIQILVERLDGGLPGDQAMVPFAFNLQGMPLDAGRYSVRVLVDGEPAEPKTFTVAAPPRTVVFGEGLGSFTLPE